jgi:hypothetical protein
MWYTTFDMLNDLLIIRKETDNQEVIIRDGRVLILVASFNRQGFIFEIYKDDNNYCAHSTLPNHEWLDIEPPLFGYYDINLSWNELLQQIANKYDSIRNSIVK